MWEHVVYIYVPNVRFTNKSIYLNGGDYDVAYRYMLHFKAPRTIADGNTCPFPIVSDNGNK